ncbi:MAG: bifunctional riboflavin kinase/FMN adenylyltransferase, partial [Pedosphaera parvula]|nr:bifunctional riboflavin kinase/FMN adenylyltransferase [Pedosphaera parvula]
FAFGKDAAGNHTYLEAMAPRLGFAIEQVPPLVVEGERVSSTLIREYILQGDLDHVERFLGRKYSIVGEVKRGRGMGAKLGYPTANIEPGNYAVPVHGVYIAEALLDGNRYQAAVNIGIAPTIRHEDIMVEAFLLGFNEDIVGKQLEVIFHRRLRPELKFNSLPDLIAAIGRDVEAVRAYFLQESKS